MDHATVTDTGGGHRSASRTECSPKPAARCNTPSPTEALRGIAALTGYILNTLFWTPPLMLLGLLKLLVPIPVWRRFCDRILSRIAGGWIAVNNLNLRLLSRIRWDVRGLDAIHSGGWHLVIANHQSWVDILVLQKIFFRRIPFLKFFIKQELIWLPVLGLAWWALDFPFVKRYSREYLKKHPDRRGKDIEITRKACAKFKQIPVSVMNFVEGTRFSREKHRIQKSPYTHLLKPKSGGVALVLMIMGDRIETVVDVTIVYPGGAPTFWQMLCGRVEAVKVQVQSIPVPSPAGASSKGTGAAKNGFNRWMNDRWAEKDRQIDVMAQW
jgi:1-acyl-sn-glycerol-3-phosphate acyltransferase